MSAMRKALVERSGHSAKGFCAAIALLACTAWCTKALAQTVPPNGDQEKSTEELAKAAQNPVADMISIPFQNNFNFGYGPFKQLQYNLNVQPVIPFHITPDWNLITRTIVPLISQPQLTSSGERSFGLGDINPTFFFSPSKASTIIWGAGPTLTLPTATGKNFGSGKWSAGPAFVALTIQGPWVIGGLLSNQWSYASAGGTSNVNAMTFQPFVNYNVSGGWYLTTSPIVSANWLASGDKWVVPIGGGFGRLFRVGKLPVNMSLSAYNNVIRPDGAANWQLRFQVQFLLPSG
jgi:hypothetical protein